ncbi:MULTISPECIES: GNAT family N-acetyltransferase [Sporosarcina]|uniref:GNAT family N-acetyltransferase n=1 Tax=Sporosarcina saromensis TaxID=359365 RepID=A0ABU4GCS5_9BACL|nr:GNAT family N-acetyltransferase [Sporosarcina saromensis]MDW0114793.1 GNAT family N-acetyltransferase [Sporosarcina saromensis]
MENRTIEELQSRQELLEGFHVMRYLRPQFTEQSYIALVEEAQKNETYRQFALRVDGRIVAVIGFQPMITLYYGKYIWVCDLVTDIAFRSKGFGEQLLTFVHSLAKKEGFDRIALSSGLQREHAHRFYEEKMGYERASFVFTKTL